MTFPYYIYFGQWGLHPHFIFELLAYLIGFQIYRRKGKEQFPNSKTRWSLIIACIGGAWVGARIVGWLEMPFNAQGELHPWPMGKTITGGLLGGWLSIEAVKKYLKITESTGDRLVFPLIVGISLGRIGCYLTGLDDNTYGIATALPWGVDFGDQVFRHPTQLYEIFWLLITGVLIQLKKKKDWLSGYQFRLLMMSYFVYRFLVEFIKPRYTGYLGLSMIQVVSLITILYSFYYFKHASKEVQSID